MSPRCQPVVFDGWRSISISLYMTLISMFSFNLLWVFVDVYQMSTAAMVGLVIYGAMYLWLRRTIPALARAT